MKMGLVVLKWSRLAVMCQVLAVMVSQGALGQEQHAATIAGYWSSDARWESRLNAKAGRANYFWVGRMWGRIDATGKIRFDAENGCIAVGLLEPYQSYWKGVVNVTGCKPIDVDGRYEITASGGKPHMSLKLSSTRYTAGLGSSIDTYEVVGTFLRYKP